MDSKNTGAEYGHIVEDGTEFRTIITSLTRYDAETARLPVLTISEDSEFVRAYNEIIDGAREGDTAWAAAKGQYAELVDGVYNEMIEYGGDTFGVDWRHGNIPVGYDRDGAYERPHRASFEDSEQGSDEFRAWISLMIQKTDESREGTVAHHFARSV